MQVLNVQVPQIFKWVVDSLNVDITSASTVWVLAGSLIIGCTYSIPHGFINNIKSYSMYLKICFALLYRWCCEDRSHTIERAVECGVREHRPARGPQSGEADV